MNTNLNKNDENSIFVEFKGKWGISNQVAEKSELTKIFNRDGNTVCAIYAKPFTKTEKQANALLISKAPEMLEMLKLAHANHLSMVNYMMMAKAERGAIEAITETIKDIETLIKQATAL